MKIKIISSLVVLFCVILLSGCATTMSLSSENAKRIHTVYVNPKVTVPDNMFFMGGGAGFLFGGIGAAIEIAANKSPGEQMTLFARQHGILIEKIVRDQFIRQMTQKTRFKVTNSINKADVTLNINITSYGLGVPNAFASSLKPILVLQANMIDKHNQMIWANSDTVRPISSGFPEYSEKAILKNPQLLQKMWGAAAQKTVSNIVSTMQ